MYAILQVNAGAARSPDGFGHLPVELAFNSKSTAIGMVIACITTAFPDGALCEGGSDGNTMLHQGCSQEVVLSNAQAVKMVKALLAFHPETASATNLRKRLPLIMRRTWSTWREKTNLSEGRFSLKAFIQET